MTIKEFEIQLALGSLSGDVKDKLAYTPSTPKKILTTLSKDVDWFVRYCVTRNSNTPEDTLITLAKDEERVVRNCAVSNLKGSKCDCQRV